MICSRNIRKAPTSTWPHIKFKTEDGANVRIDVDGRRATQQSIVDWFAFGLAFSDRPIAINEVVSLRLAEVSLPSNRSGLKFGVTSCAPASYLLLKLPPHEIPGVAHDYWIDRLPDEYFSTNNLLQFAVSPSGDINYSINGKNKGILRAGVPTDRPLWVVVELHGDRNIIEFERAPDSLMSDAIHAWSHAARFHATPTAPLTPSSSESDDEGPMYCEPQLAPRQAQSHQQGDRSRAYGSQPPRVGAATTSRVIESGVQGVVPRSFPVAAPLNWINHEQQQPESSQAASSINNLRKEVPGACLVEEAFSTVLSLKSSEFAQDEALPASVAREASPASENNETHTSSASNRHVCTLCESAEVDAMFYPCGHMGTCYECALKWKAEESEKQTEDKKPKVPGCPFCRKPITDISRPIKL